MLYTKNRVLYVTVNDITSLIVKDIYEVFVLYLFRKSNQFFNS